MKEERPMTYEVTKIISPIEGISVKDIIRFEIELVHLGVVESINTYDPYITCYNDTTGKKVAITFDNMSEITSALELSPIF